MSDIVQLSEAQERLREYGDAILALGGWYANRAAKHSNMATKHMMSALLSLIQDDKDSAIAEVKQAIESIKLSDADLATALETIDNLIKKKSSES